MYLERPLKDFIKDTSSRTPTPGGGSVAALVGALGSALLSMVGNFTRGKKKFESVQDEVKKILQELDSYTSRFCELIEEDISAYQNFSRVLSLPKNTQQEQKARAKAMEDALKRAAQVPLKTAGYSLELLKVASRLLTIGNPNLISDVGVGAILAKATLESAALNVEINLSYIKDVDFIKEKRESLRSVLIEGEKLAGKIVEEVQKKIAPDSF